MEGGGRGKKFEEEERRLEKRRKRRKGRKGRRNGEGTNVLITSLSGPIVTKTQQHPFPLPARPFLQL